MPDKKLTDAEVVKALEDTLHRIKGAEYLIVPKEGVENLCNGLQNALDLINRQKAEIKKQNETIKNFKDTKQRLRTKNLRLNNCFIVLCKLVKMADKIEYMHNFQYERSDIVEYIYQTHEIMKVLKGYDNQTMQNFLKEIAGDNNDI